MIYDIDDLVALTSVGDRIRIARETKGLSQKQLSIMSGTSPAGVCRWESNERELKLSNIIALCEALEVTPNWLIFGQKEKQPSKDDCLKSSYEVIGRYEDEVKDLKAQLDTVVKTMNDRIEAANLHSKELCDRVHKKIDKTIDEQTRIENEITHLKDTDIKVLESKIDSLADRVWKVEIKSGDAKALFSKTNDRIKVVDEGLLSLKREVLDKVEPDIRQLYFEDLPRIEKLETKVSNLEFDTQKLLAEMSKMLKDQEHDFRITCSTEEPRCIDCSYSEENGKSCSAEGCICYSKFTPKEKGD